MSAQSSVMVIGMCLKLGRLTVSMGLNCNPLLSVPERPQGSTAWFHQQEVDSILDRGLLFHIGWTGSKESASPTAMKMDDTGSMRSDVMKPGKAETLMVGDVMPIVRLFNPSLREDEWKQLEGDLPECLLCSPSTTDSSSSPE